jgi:hypothetical protein
MTDTGKPILITSETELAPCGARPGLRWQRDPFYGSAPSEEEVAAAVAFLQKFASAADTWIDTATIQARCVRWAAIAIPRFRGSASRGAVGVAALRLGFPVVRTASDEVDLLIRAQVAALSASVFTFRQREEEPEEMGVSELAIEARNVLDLS